MNRYHHQIVPNATKKSYILAIFCASLISIFKRCKRKKKEWNLSRNVHVRGVESMSLQNWKCKAVNKMVLRNLPTLPTYLFYRSRRILFSGRIEKPSSLFLGNITQGKFFHSTRNKRICETRFLRTFKSIY